MKNLKEIRIDDFLYPNYGLGPYGEGQVKVKNALPGRLVTCKVKKKKDGSFEGKHVSDLEASPRETHQGCGNPECGGCFFQSLSYEDEKEIKLRGLGNLAQAKGLDLKLKWHDNPRPVGYRNKMEYTFGDQAKGGELFLGLHKKKRFYEIVDTGGCNIVHPDFETIRSAVQAYFRGNKQAQYIRSQHLGFLRHLVIRYSLTEGQILVNLVTSSQDRLDAKAFVDMILGLDLEGEVTGILHTINDSMADTVQADELKVLYGKDHIFERVLGLRFKVSAFSFFQPNVFGIENLYARLLEMASQVKPSVVFDLYSGTGTIGQVLSKVSDKVVGVEIVEEAVEAARENAKLNGIKNVEFIANDVLEEIGRLKDPADLIVLDPPRSGIVPKALKGILEHKPKNLIYISCNPRTMMEDFHTFFEEGYKIVGEVEIYDQFTRTYHAEAVALLSKEEVD